MTILCNEHTTSKEKVTEKTLAKSNKNGFKNNVGTVTNRATSMYDVLVGLEKGSEEYNILKKRIASSQLLQQAVIDSAKSGIVSMSMPKNWYDRKSCKNEIDKILCCDKKPYFMIYVYKQVKSDYENWLKTWNMQSMRMFGVNTSMEDLIDKVSRTEEEQEFLNMAYDFKPITDNKCLMNNICHYVEDQFKGFIGCLIKEKNFDYSVFKYNVDTTINLKNKILKILEAYNKKEEEKMRQLFFDKDYEQQYKTNFSSLNLLKNEIIKKYNKEKVFDCLIDIINEKNNYKHFLWEMFGEEIIDKLIKGDGINE